MPGKYSWNFLIIQLERAAGHPGLVIVCGGKTELTPLQTDISLGLSETQFREVVIIQLYTPLFICSICLPINHKLGVIVIREVNNILCVCNINYNIKIATL